MSRLPSIRNAGRAITFARYMPVAKLARRVELEVRRRLRDKLVHRLAVEHDGATAPRSASPPLPLMPPRAGLAPQFLSNGSGWRFTFLRRSVEMASKYIDWSAPGTGSANQLWRMNLHYMEYLEGVDDEACVRLMLDWIEANPARRPGVWRDSWNSYALSLRVVVWMQELARRGGRLQPEPVARVEASLCQQIRFLERNLETDLGGNHLVKNIKALIWASAYFQGAEAERWRRRGLALLGHEIETQILPDGVHDERSASYHCQVLVDLLECRQALGGDPLGGRLDETLSRMAKAAADLAHPDGGPALFNDSGLDMAYAPDACLTAYERLFGQRADTDAVFAYRNGGYFGIRSQRHYLVVDCGRIAPDDLPAHGHGDVLSFELSVDGLRFVVDQGVYEYIAGDRRRRARAAASHNTLCIDGADQADFFGAFRCGRRPNVTLRDWEPRADGFVLEGSHDGFTHLPGRPVHVRRLEASSSGIEIEDRIEGEGRQAARIGFLLHPAVEVTTTGCTAVLKRNMTVIDMSASLPIEVEAAVWWPNMGEELATHRLVVRLPPGTTRAAIALEFRHGTFATDKTS